MHKNKKTASPKKVISKTPKSVFQNFQQLYISEIPDADLAEINHKSLELLIKRQFDLADKRTKNKISIEVDNPTLKNWGWDGSNTVISILFDDMSFVIDSVTALLTRHGFNIANTFHPLLYTLRGKNRKIEDISLDTKEGYTGEGFLFIELSRRLTKPQIDILKTEISDVLSDVQLATGDWRQIKERVKAAHEGLKEAPDIDFDDLQEYLEFINYIHDDNFTLLGYKYYKASKKGGKLTFTPDHDSGLGLLSKNRKKPYLNGEEKILFEDTKTKETLPAVFVHKLALKSSVHRSVPMDSILVRQYDKKGNVIGEALIVGLFTSVTYSRSIRGVPFLRHKGTKIINMAGFDPQSHDLRALRDIIEKFPRDEFMQTAPKDLYETSLKILRLKERPRISLFLREDPFGRTLSALIYIPRDRFDTRLRLKFERILEEELEASCTRFTSTVDDSPLVRIIYSLQWQQGKRVEYDTSMIEARLQEAGRSWDEVLFQTLMEKYRDHDEAARISDKYNSAFPVSYQERYRGRQALHDIAKIEEVLTTRQIDLDLFKPQNTPSRHLSLKVYSPGVTISLSDILPVLENMGLKVIEEYPFEVLVQGRSVWIQDLVVEIPAQLPSLDVSAIRHAFEACFKLVWSGHVENDSLNKLIVLAALNSREIAILRSYVRYLRQTTSPYSLSYVEQALTDYPSIAKLLTGLFKAHFDPDTQGKGKAVVPGVLAAIDQNLQHVSALDQDKILRSLTSLIQATLRTNYFQNKPWISLKFDSAAVPELPDPRPYREIFVYSPRVEGIHLRGDVIARGGLRWSDRNEDFRTEVLGLMKAQQVKNAIIIPMGAKGGFIVKKPPVIGGREAFLEEGKECYRIFIRGLLDITDNQKGGKIIPPRDVVRRDDNDPYLVVAADKGTATFSDIANALSAEYDFWLGDAFASGGSHGYDHKDMGITARGAWESVKRHFHELGLDTQTQEFDIIGIGDMGGDVFGNGLLQTKTARLVGAFNHLHIFCDPNPDAAATYKERERLFKEVKGWDHYNEKLLSKGGRIYKRSDKSLKLTSEIQKRFGLSKSEVSPIELIRAMLMAKTDLLFFGGIGTYVKSTKEAHIDAGDRSNDPLRVNGSELRARVIGEGANLGMTQRGRIEYAQQGGRLNTDFIDNSAGVDTSDHEVNIKILLSDVMAQKNSKMNLKSRDKLLESMTKEVEQLVLRDNYQQAQALSLITSKAAENVVFHAKLMTLLEHDGLLRRDIEFLPDDEAIEKRRLSGLGLTRPELCVLFSYSKIAFTKDLIATKIPDDKSMLEWAIRYFPVAMQKKFADEIKNHRLKRNIIATMISNAIINRMGPSFIRLTMAKTGKNVEEITRAYIKVRDEYDLRDLWDGIEALDNKIDAETQLKALREIADIAAKQVLSFLKTGKLSTRTAPLSEAQNQSDWMKAGLPSQLAVKMARLKSLSAD